jgi:hypothetical protein
MEPRSSQLPPPKSKRDLIATSLAAAGKHFWLWDARSSRRPADVGTRGRDKEAGRAVGPASPLGPASSISVRDFLP